MSQDPKPNYMERAEEIIRKQREKDHAMFQRIELEGFKGRHFEIVNAKGDDKKSEETHPAGRAGSKTILFHADTEEELLDMIEEFKGD